MFKIILENTTYLLVSEVIVRLISLVQVPILVRYLGKNDYGIWSLAGALPGILLIITDFGLHSHIIREISRDNNKLQSSFQNIFLIKLFLSGIFLFFVWVFVRFLGYSENVRLFIYIMSLSFVFTSLQGLFSSLLRGTQRFLYDGLLQVASMMSLFAGVLFAVVLEYGLLGLVYSQLLSQVVIVLICLKVYLKKYGVNYGLFSGLEQLVSILRKSLPFALIAVVLPVYYQADIILLSKLSGYEATGVYSAAYKIILMLTMISRLFSQVLFPSLSKLFVTSKEEFRKVFDYSYKAMALLVYPISFGLFLLGDRIVILLFRGEFADAIPALRIMAFSLLFTSLQSVLTVSLNSCKEEKKVAFVMVVVTATNIIMNLILIPKFAFIGASISTLVSEVIRFTGNYYYFRKRVFKIRFRDTIGKVIVACLIMSLFVIWFKEMVLPILIILAGMLYVILTWLFGVLSKEEIRKVANLLTRKRAISESIR